MKLISTDIGEDTDHQHAAEDLIDREGGFVGRKGGNEQGRFGRGPASHRPSGPQRRKPHDERERYR